MSEDRKSGHISHATLGLGWYDAPSRTFRFFDSPARPEIVVPVVGQTARRVMLEKEQRVWWHDGIRWLVGRVDSPGPDATAQYFVHFPNGRTGLFPSCDLKARWSQPIADPDSLLQAGATETRFFHGRRSAFLRSVTAQRAACEGFGGILSSAVDLHAHQVGAARRVLLDPVRRYLLADEVGLGKTIEAGMVLRQLMIEDLGDALVLVPSPLVEQWKEELDRKFRVAQFGGRVRVLSHGALQDIEPSPRLLVIVDEAHRLAEGIESNPAAAERYDLLRAIVHSATSTLLLSATPVRSNEDAFLRLLHLLDPVNYSLTDLDAFRQRVAIRDQMGEALAAIDEETPLAYLRDPGEELRNLLPHDDLVASLIDELDRAVNEGDELAARASCRKVRVHLSETYRLHRRMIRTRRTSSLLRTFPVRGRERDPRWMLSDPDSRRSGILLVVDSVRMQLAGTQRDGATTAFRTLLGRAMAPTTALRDVAAFLRGGSDHDLQPEEVVGLEILRTLIDTSSIAESLEGAILPEVNEDRFSVACEWARGHVGRDQVAVVCSFARSALQFAEIAEASLGKHRVARLLSTMTEQERAESLSGFRADRTRTVVVIDHVGEEGLNLQSIAAVLHLDLPVTMSRLEQRLGRFDRWSDGVAAPVRSVVFADYDPIIESHFGAWRRALDEGVGIFERSTATLQYVLPGVEERFLIAALEEGLPEAGDAVVSLREDLQRQTRRIAGQDILDAIDDHSDDERYVAQLDAIDRQHKEIATTFSDYASQMLGLSATPTPIGVRYGINKTRPPMLTESQIMALGPEQLRLPYESDRSRVSQGAGFLRWGEPLVNNFEVLASGDERGRAFIAEFTEAGLERNSAPHFVFCFDVLIQAGDEAIAELASVDPTGARTASSQVLRFLPPRIERIWLVPGRGEPPEQFIKHIEDKKGVNLGSRPDRFEELTVGRQWSHHCEEQSLAALRIVANRRSVVEQLSTGRNAARRSHERDQAIASARIRAGGDDPVDNRIVAAVTAALDNPRIAIDSCGAIIVTPIGFAT